MVKGLEEPFLMKVFLKGLKEEISTEVKLHEPKNLIKAMVNYSVWFPFRLSLL